MSLRDLINTTYQETVEQAQIPSDLKTALKANERVPLFLRNLERELAVVPAKFQTREQAVFATRELTLFFLKNVEKRANEMMLSDAERLRIHTEHHKAQILDSAATTGIIDEEVMSVLNEES